MIPPLRPDLPPTLVACADLAERRLGEALAGAPEATARRARWSAAQQADWRRVAALSDFVVEQFCRLPEPCLALVDSGALHQALAPGEMAQRLREDLADCPDEAELGRRLRRFRMLQQVRIVWRDLTRQADLLETCRDLSDLADACIDQACAWLYAQQCAQFGVPTGRHSGQPQQLVVLGMGKLGAGELNLSSDIDLIFAYGEAGETRGARREQDNQEFFTRLGQRLIKALDAVTVDGFVFRVDMRLRPYGSAGALVLSFAAMELYYQDQGRDWERYAMIKARVVGGDQASGAELLTLLRPFVYRRYLDFSAIEALRSMKQLIRQEVRRRGMTDNVKLGAGGIREVEFIAQAYQLIHGGRDPALQQRPLLQVLPSLRERGYLPASAETELREGYSFLRYVEHALQAIADQQTQTLPVDPQNRARVAFLMGYADWDAFYAALDGWRTRVDWHFQQTIADPEEEAQSAELEDSWLPLWEDLLDPEESLARLREAGFQAPEQALELLAQLRASGQVRAMQRAGRERLDAFMPRLLDAVSVDEQPDRALERVLPLVEAVARRSAYLVLLSENPPALARLLELCGASAWVAEQIARYPALLDELLNEGRLYNPPQKPELAAELRERLMRLPEEDLEQQMDVLRHFKRAHSLRVAAAEIVGSLPLMKVSDYLTWLAEVILEEVFGLAWRQLVQRHGTPQRRDGSPCQPDFVIVGYGKVGGIELGHGSDLDLVFIHDADPLAETDGAKPLDGAQFFNRLGQRLIHLLTTTTPVGTLYEVDMRLRPSGAAGLLVSSLEAFERYQGSEAWTWEHQALVRARVVAGCPLLGERFDAVRARILGRQRELATLRADVASMRDKMLDNLGTALTAGGLGPNARRPELLFDLKQDAGGIVDIEFMVQYAVLAWSWQHPELLRFPDNIRILESLEAVGLLPATDAIALREAYKAYRAAMHRLVLQKQPGKVPADGFLAERDEVRRIWHGLGLDAASGNPATV